MCPLPITHHLTIYSKVRAPMKSGGQPKQNPKSIFKKKPGNLS